ncbi:Anaphase-promoting complex subunit 8 [Elasticomyces elasticus]|nr:Anaphase-promoting complex subunit 8 [Elasticomyces elasticus]KAK3658863.1 Anaphase-promoting complex subunit 8 [Elasticomyces elasticus]KAK4932706.1 Anaphase-promoting complex subunit 8 [Elasticomyces elasticus]KAK5769728.1 Anaphase-promoting complex subunit 8 [Elasticomyces elasticus]
MALSPTQQIELQTQLQQAVISCSERCLYFAAKWAAELATSFPSSDTDQDEDTDLPPPIQHLNPDPKEARLEARELPRYLLAKSLFDTREFDRCASVFLPVQVPHSTPGPHVTGSTTISLGSSQNQYKLKLESDYRPKLNLKGNVPLGKQPSTFSTALPKNVSQKSLFLALYARYMSGEKRKNEDSETILGPSDGPMTANKELPSILATLEAYFASRGGLQDLTNSQGWLDYLYGLCLLRSSISSADALAKQWLLRAVNIQPYNWSAWLDLASLVGSVEELAQLTPHLPKNIVTLMFCVHINQELFQQGAEVFGMVGELEGIFPGSAWLMQQKATLHYHTRDHETAQQIFKTLLRDHPGRLEGLEVYSNLLYILPDRPGLAALASMASDIDKFRSVIPPPQVTLGRFGEQLRLDRSRLANATTALAPTLFLGSDQATSEGTVIAAVKSTPETNCILGNYYALLASHEKAILHFRRALTLDRTFQTAWTLMGHEYIELKNTQAAIESYRRAVDTNRKDYRAWYGLGQGYEMLECWSYSLFYYQRAAGLCPGDPKMWAAVGGAFGRCGKVANGVQAFKRALVVGGMMDGGGSFGSSAGNGNDPLAHAVGGALDPSILYEIACLYEKSGSWDEAAAYMELALAQEEGAEDGDGYEGLGVTQITCKARLWLARFCYVRGEWARALELGNELCQDGWEVEEAKGLVGDVRGRMSLAEEDGEGHGCSWELGSGVVMIGTV